jgi:hypothetical protein
VTCTELRLQSPVASSSFFHIRSNFINSTLIFSWYVFQKLRLYTIRLLEQL